MSVSRRKFIKGGLLTAAAISGLAATEKIADHYGLIPPDSGGLWGPGETLTYATQRLLMASHSMAREFNRSEISQVAPVNGPMPTTEDFERLQFGGFKDWRLAIDGLVARPAALTLDDIKRMPARSQITHQACEEGWSFIAEWAGVPLVDVFRFVGVLPQARYAVFDSFDGVWDSLDLPDATHPQTLLAYKMNGEDLPADHGAPLRLRVARQLGYKSVKYLRKITLVDSLKHVGDGTGSISPSVGYSWFAGI